MQALIMSAVIFAVAGFFATQAAVASPKKALGDYSKLCQDEHLKCLNDCQNNYSSEADIRACFGVCDDWLDDACDPVFPKALKIRPGTVLAPLDGGVIEPLAPVIGKQGIRVPPRATILQVEPQ
jgi:hypothetical protein